MEINGKEPIVFLLFVLFFLFLLSVSEESTKIIYFVLLLAFYAAFVISRCKFC